MRVGDLETFNRYVEKYTYIQHLPYWIKTLSQRSIHRIKCNMDNKTQSLKCERNFLSNYLQPDEVITVHIKFYSTNGVTFSNQYIGA